MIFDKKFDCWYVAVVDCTFDVVVFFFRKEIGEGFHFSFLLLLWPILDVRLLF